MMDIRQARVDEYERILEFYNDVLDGLEDAQYHPRWQKGIYPTEASLRKAIENKQLYVGMVGTGMVAAMVAIVDSRSMGKVLSGTSIKHCIHRVCTLLCTGHRVEKAAAKIGGGETYG